MAALPRTIPERFRHELALLQLTRVLFLYFVQAKGWLDGSERFLPARVDDCLFRRRRIHRDLLLPLFFGTLNRPLTDRRGAARVFGRIPFLNGGLFEPHSLERRFHPDIPDPVWRDAFDTLFERYHFTVAEAGPGSIAPEMLGRVFEGVMDPFARKGSGTYYTPAAVVRGLIDAALAGYIGGQLGLTDAESLARLESGDQRALRRPPRRHHPRPRGRFGRLLARCAGANPGASSAAPGSKPIRGRSWPATSMASTSTRPPCASPNCGFGWRSSAASRTDHQTRWRRCPISMPSSVRATASPTRSGSCCGTPSGRRATPRHSQPPGARQPRQAGPPNARRFASSAGLNWTRRLSGWTRPSRTANAAPRHHRLGARPDPVRRTTRPGCQDANGAQGGPAGTPRAAERPPAPARRRRFPRLRLRHPLRRCALAGWLRSRGGQPSMGARRIARAFRPSTAPGSIPLVARGRRARLPAPTGPRDCVPGARVGADPEQWGARHAAPGQARHRLVWWEGPGRPCGTRNGPRPRRPHRDTRGPLRCRDLSTRDRGSIWAPAAGHRPRLGLDPRIAERQEPPAGCGAPWIVTER